MILTAAGGCGTTAPTVSKDFTEPTPPEGVVVGKFGALPSQQHVGATGRRMTFLSLTDGREWKVDFLEHETDDDGRTAPFAVRLPAGTYRVRKWSLHFMDTVFYTDDDSMSLQFEVVAGEVTCIGALHPIRRARWRTGEAPQVRRSRVLLLPGRDCPAVEAILRARAPNLRVPVRTRLATNLSCPGCQADASYESRYLTTGMIDLADIPVATAERLRSSALFPSPVRWPGALTAEQASILMKVCVSLEGRVDAVTVIEPAHPLLDPQVVDAARSWQYRPLIHQGEPVPFCYRRGFTFDHPAAGRLQGQ